MRFEIGTLHYMDRIILTTEVARKSWILSKRSLKYMPQRGRAIQRKAFGDSE